MNNEIREDLYKEKYNEYVNNFIKNIILDNPIILKEYPYKILFENSHLSKYHERNQP